MKTASRSPFRASARSVSSTGQPALLLVLCLLLSMAPTPTAHMQAGTEIVVTTFGDELNSDGDCSLREAIEAANTNAAVDACPAGAAESGSIDSIILDAGTYTLELAGQKENQNQTGDLDIRSSMRFVGQGAEQTIIDASQIDRVFDIIDNNYPSVSVEMSGVTIRNGMTPKIDLTFLIDPQLQTEVLGGGIRSSGQLTLQDTAVISNTAGHLGGGIINVGSLTARNSRINGNTALDDVNDLLGPGSGAGMGGGILTSEGTVLLQNSDVSNNNGNGIASLGGSNVTIQGSSVSGNHAQDYSSGAGIVSVDSTLLLEQGSSVSGNHAPLDGGGIMSVGAEGIARLTIRDSTISNNTAEEAGGGIFNAVNAILEVYNSTISGNAAGGAINTDDTSEGGGGGGIVNGGQATIEGSTITGNTAVGGAGIANVYTFHLDQINGNPVLPLVPASVMDIRDSSIDGNQAVSLGGGVLNLGSLNVAASSVNRNTAQEGAGISNDPTGVMTITNVLVEENSAESPQGAEETAANVGGGGIRNYGALQIVSSSISHNMASGLSEVDYGGGILNLGSLEIIENSQINANHSKTGGGIYNTLTGTLTLQSSTVLSNTALYSGGGLVNNGKSTLVGATISGNEVMGVENAKGVLVGGEGGGIINRTPEGKEETTIEIIDSVIVDNTSITAGGLANAGQMTITRTQIRGNSAQRLAGGIFNFSTVEGKREILGATLSLVESTISDNRAGVNGGGLYNVALAYLIDSTIADNSAAGDGGGVFNTGGVGIRSSTIRGNSALGDNGGGGIYSVGKTGSSSAVVILNSTLMENSASNAGGGLHTNNDTLLTNVTVSNNTAAELGGGINVDSSGRITVTNVTLSHNTLTGDIAAGAGIFSNGDALFVNSILAHNEPAASCVGGGGDIISQGHNLMDNESCALNEPGDVLAADALLGDLTDNGGNTPTRALLDGSPAIDSGSNAACPPTDQRGFVRPSDGDADGSATCDIGAYEAAAQPPVVIDEAGGPVQFPDSDLDMTFPPEAVEGRLTLKYTELPTATYTLAHDVFWLRGFLLEGFDGSLQPVTTLLQPINITLSFASLEQPEAFDASKLDMVVWDAAQGEWVPMQSWCGSCGVSVNRDTQEITIVTDRLGEFALLHPQQNNQPESLSVYLPLVRR